MALVIAPSHGPTNADPTSSLQDALQKFQRTLSAEQQKLFSQQYQKPEASDVLKFVADLDANNQSRSGRCVASRVCTFLEATQQFTAVVETFVSSNPSIAALVWGTVKIALVLAGNAASYFDKVTTMIMNVGRSCPVLAMFGPLYPGCVGLQEALCGYYSVVVRLCVRVVEVQQRTGLKYVWSSLMNPFESEFKSVLEAIDSSVQLVHLQINLASKQAATETSKLMELDRKSNEAFRISSLKFRKEVAQEREEARFWRMNNAQRNAENLRGEIKDRLSSLDHLKPWKQAQRRRMPSTAEWFQQDPVFEKWRKDQEPAILWCAGLMGAGKTVFASNVVAYLLRTREKDEVIVHHFCQTDLETSLSAREIIGTLARQIIAPQLESLDNIELRALYDQCAGADVSDLVAMIRLRIDKNKTYFILIDGLDECAKEDIEAVAASVDEICVKGAVCLKTIYVGRPGLEEHLFRQRPTGIYRLPVTKATVTADIETYIAGKLDQCLEDGRLKLNDPTLIIKIRETLEKQADGMFLWVYLFIDEICAQSTDDEILKALQEPPEQLSKLLDLKMSRIGSTRAVQKAIKVLQLCGVAKRPLLSNELRELISISIGQDSLNVTNLPHSIGEIIDQCGGLVYIDEEDFAVQYVHHSIQQYLFSPHGLYQADFAKEEQDEQLGFLALTYLHFSELGRQLAKVEKDANTTIKPAYIAVSSIADRYRKTGKVAQLLLRHQSSLRGLTKNELDRKAQELAGQTTTDRLDSELASRQFHALKYAREHWIWHLIHSDLAKNDRMRRLFQACVDGSNELAQRPWSRELNGGSEVSNWTKRIDDAVDWAITEGQTDFFRYCVGIENYVLSEQRKIDACDNAPLASLQAFLKIIIERTVYHDRTLAHLLVWLAHKRQYHVLIMVLDLVKRPHCPPSEAVIIALSYAASDGHLEVVGKLLSTVPVDLDAFLYAQAFEVAARFGYLEIVNRLLVAGAEVDATVGDLTQTALHSASRNGHLDVVNSLLSANANVNATDHNGETALHKAARCGHAEVVDRLLSARANCNAVTNSGWTALSYAAEGGHLRVVNSLLSSDANVNGNTPILPLLEAARCGNVKVVKKLLLAGANVDAADRCGFRALEGAVSNNHIDVLNQLLVAKVNLNVFTKNGKRILQIAIENGYLDMARRLEAAGAER